MNFIKQIVSVDVSKDELVVCLGSLFDNQQTKFSSKATFANSLKGARHLLKWAVKMSQKGVPFGFVMEATGVYHETLAYYLHQKGQPVSVLLPTQTKAYAKSLNLKSKTDSIDAQMLAQFGLERALQAWQPPSAALRQLKAYTREHQSLQESKTALLNQLHAKEHAYQIPEDTKKRLREMIRLYKQQLKTIEQKIHELINSDPDLKGPIERIAKVKGLGVLTIAKVVAETAAFATFENGKQLASFTGYDVVHHRSGNTTRKTKISKKGNAHIRAALHWPAIVAVKWNNQFKTFYDRIMINHTAKMVGYTAVARKLLVLIFTLWKNKSDYDPNYEINKSSRAVAVHC